MNTTTTSHFVLVHGLCHGAWCWYKIIPLLKSTGHRVTALDMGASGINPKRVDEVESFADYSQPLMDFMASLPPDEKVVLVGHSFGGIGISFAMETFPNKIAASVYVTALMPSCTTSPESIAIVYSKQMPLEAISLQDGPDKLADTIMFTPDCMATCLYQNCSLEDIELAKTLLRPGRRFHQDIANEFKPTRDNFGSVNRVFIVCEDDKIFSEAMQRWMISSSPPVEVKSVVRADHMIMLSKPKELCSVLEEIAEVYH